MVFVQVDLDRQDSRYVFCQVIESEPNIIEKSKK